MANYATMVELEDYVNEFSSKLADSTPVQLARPRGPITRRGRCSTPGLSNTTMQVSQDMTRMSPQSLLKQPPPPAAAVAGQTISLPVQIASRRERRISHVFLRQAGMTEQQIRRIRNLDSGKSDKGQTATASASAAALQPNRGLSCPPANDGENNVEEGRVTDRSPHRIGHFAMLHDLATVGHPILHNMYETYVKVNDMIESKYRNGHICQPTVQTSCQATEADDGCDHDKNGSGNKNEQQQAEAKWCDKTRKSAMHNVLTYLLARLPTRIQSLFDITDGDRKKRCKSEAILVDMEHPHRYRPEDIGVLCQATGFSVEEMKRLYRGFKTHCPSGIVTEDAFHTLFAAFFPKESPFAFKDKRGRLCRAEKAWNMSPELVAACTARRAATAAAADQRRRLRSCDQADESSTTMPKDPPMLTRLRCSIKRAKRKRPASATSSVVGSSASSQIASPSWRTGVSSYSQYVFKTLDRSGIGYITFEDFVLTLSILTRSGREEKLRWTFLLYDQDGDGYISRREMEDIAGSVFDLLGRTNDIYFEEQVITERVDYVFKKMDTTNNGLISLMEFLAVCTQDPILSQNLNTYEMCQ